MQKYFRHLILTLGIAAIVGLSFVVIFDTKEVFADPATGDIIITVENELGTSVSGAIFTFNCDGTNHAVTDGGAGDDDSASNGTIHILAATVDAGTSGCDNNDAFTSDTVLKDGFVIENTTLENYVGTPGISWNEATTSLDFAMNVTGITDEINNALTGVTVMAGDSFGTSCTESSGEWYCAVPLGDRDRDVLITKDGYVQYNTAVENITPPSDRESASDPPMTIGIDGVKFAHKITGVIDELGNTLTPDYVNVWPISLLCTSSNGTIYCPIPLAGDDSGLIQVFPSGYGGVEVEIAGNRTDHADAQIIVEFQNSYPSLQFAHRVYVKNELNTDLTPDSVTAGANNTVCTIDGFTAYCPIPVEDDDDLSDGFVIAKDGYVTANIDLLYNRSDNGDTTEDSRVQMDASNGLDFAVKTTVTKASDSSALSGATVSTGDLLAVTCTENGVTGIYYCAVPLAHTANEVNVTKSGYTSNAGTFTDRTLSTDPQRTVSIALSVPVVSSGGGGGVVPQVSCSSVTYGEWQNSCVNGIQYRNIFSETGCAITAAQRSAAQRSCTNESISETPQTPSSGSSLIEQVTALEKTLTETINTILTNSLLGRILLQVESHGESWYLNPVDSSRYFMGRPLDAFNLMKRFALGVNNADMQEFLLRGAPRRLSGRIVMNVDDKGKAYYVNPLNLKLYYLGNPDNAFSIMKSFGLGISNIHLRQIKVGEL